MRHALNDQSFVKEQYQDSANLDARIALHERFSTHPQDFPRWVMDQFDLPGSARILEVGCGTGMLWTKNRDRVPPGWQVTLADYSFGMLSKARSALPSAPLANCDAQDIPLQSGCFDGVIANHMLYHVPNIDRALGEMRRILGPNGKLYAATNGLDHMHEVGTLLTELFQTEAVQPVKPFALENGAEQLARHFKSVRRLDFPDGLVVTEVEPLVAYIMSMRLADSRGDMHIEEQVRERVAEQIQREGAFRIHKSVGMFEATP